MHDGEHQHGGGKIIEVDRDDEGDDGKYPKHLPAAARAKQLAHEVEAAVVIEYIHDGHGGEQKEHDLGSPAHLWQEDVPGDEVLHVGAGGFQVREVQIMAVIC